MKAKQVYVVAVSDLNLDEDLYDLLADYYECRNGSYHRYYPNKPNDDFSEKYGKLKQAHLDIINAKIAECGIVAPADERFFHVLLEFSW